MRHESLLRASDTCLMVVDVQAPLLGAIWEPDRLLANVRLLVQAARILELPVVVTEQNRDRLGETVAGVRECLGDGVAALNKITFSCLGDEAIAAAVQATGRSQVLVCGMETHVCISQTVHDLVASGYTVHVAEDAVSSRSQSNHHTGLRRMQVAGALSTSAETAIYEMLERAGTQPFREILKLVK